MSITVSSILSDFNSNVNSCLEIDKVLRKTLAKNKIRYKNIYSYTDRKGRLKIKIKVDSMMVKVIVENILFLLLVNLVRTPLSIAQDGCTIRSRN